MVLIKSMNYSGRIFLIIQRKKANNFSINQSSKIDNLKKANKQIK